MIDRKKIIMAYMKSDVKDLIPDRPGYIPGFGKTSNIRMQVTDLMNIYLRLKKSGNEDLADETLMYVKNTLKRHKCI